MACVWEENLPLYSLISMSTPAGRSNFTRASTVLGVGSKISTNLLWERISNCSLESLSINGDLRTQYLLVSVGKGIGPDTLAPVLLAVSTILLAD